MPETVDLIDGRTAVSYIMMFMVCTMCSCIFGVLGLILKARTSSHLSGFRNCQEVGSMCCVQYLTKVNVVLLDCLVVLRGFLISIHLALCNFTLFWLVSDGKLMKVEAELSSKITIMLASA